MSTTEEILAAARNLGKQVGSHETAKKLKAAIAGLRADVDAQRLLNDFNRHVTAIAEKEAQGQPIEVADKHELERLQKGVISNRLLRDLQVAQMDHVDLMRQIDEAIAEQSGMDPRAMGSGLTPEGDPNG